MARDLRIDRRDPVIYSFIYEPYGDEVVVIAVAHGKRRPNYWRERATEK